MCSSDLGSDVVVVVDDVKCETTEMRAIASAAPLPSEISIMGDGPLRRGSSAEDKDINGHHDEEHGEIRDREVK